MSETKSKRAESAVSANRSKLEESVYNDDYKFDIPDVCFLTLMKNTKIEKLPKKYYLVAHPFPMFEGEMLLI